MPVTLEQFGLDQLSREDRLELLGLIWDSVAAVPLPLPDWHLRELERRRAHAEKYPDAVVTLEEVKARLLGES